MSHDTLLQEPLMESRRKPYDRGTLGSVVYPKRGGSSRMMLGLCVELSRIKEASNHVLRGFARVLTRVGCGFEERGGGTTGTSM